MNQDPHDQLLLQIRGAVSEYKRKRKELSDTQNALHRQLRQLESQVQKQLDVAKLASGIVDFCDRIQQTLPTLTFQQRRELVTLLIDRVVVDDEKVEIRYVIPTSPAGEKKLFCHLCLDYRGMDFPAVVLCHNLWPR
jgi:site-specific DNA recombinase